MTSSKELHPFRQKRSPIPRLRLGTIIKLTVPMQCQKCRVNGISTEVKSGEYAVAHTEDGSKWTGFDCLKHYINKHVQN